MTIACKRLKNINAAITVYEILYSVYLFVDSICDVWMALIIDVVAPLLIVLAILFTQSDL